jgi:hypothetical protein
MVNSAGVSRPLTSTKEDSCPGAAKLLIAFKAGALAIA